MGTQYRCVAILSRKEGGDSGVGKLNPSSQNRGIIIKNPLAGKGCHVSMIYILAYFFQHKNDVCQFYYMVIIAK